MVEVQQWVIQQKRTMEQEHKIQISKETEKEIRDQAV